MRGEDSHPDPQRGHSHIVVQPIPAVRGRDGRGGPIVLVGAGPVAGAGPRRPGSGPVGASWQARQSSVPPMSQGRGDEAEVEGLSDSNFMPLGSSGL